ncbi:hypothetical protein HIM_07883 [Hirsutella minnesotensis 3608]|uniref:Uncharacterized protein n=1 Tax=Hirsutella minnesotensis 3608 TaxID=1043627 RepID=A0A0F7ZHI3_9HYPO|nr:hypothetical protein HIM_07883 [Hirsutella minnesotensis 3608]
MNAAERRRSEQYWQQYGNGEPNLELDNAALGPLRVPGFPLPVSIEKCPSERFAHGFNDWAQDRLTAREVAMLSLMNEITDRPNWHLDIKYEATAEIWRCEALRRSSISPLSWEWVLLELRDKAERFAETTSCLVLDANTGVYKSETDLSLLWQIRKIVSPLFRGQRVPGFQRLVDPNHLPLIYGRTRVLSDGGRVDLHDCTSKAGQGITSEPKILKLPSDAERWHNMQTHFRVWTHSWETHPERFSTRFQWLPCEVEFTGQDQKTARPSVRISSYINNLDPVRHGPVYSAIEALIAQCIEPWNQVLVFRDRGRCPPRIKTYGAFLWPPIPDWARSLDRIEEDRDENPAAYREACQKVDDFGVVHFQPPAGPPRPRHRRDRPSPDLDSFTKTRSRLGLEFALKLHKFKSWMPPEPGISFLYDEWKRGEASRPIVAINRRKFDHPDEDSKHEFYTIELEKTFRTQGLQLVVEIASVNLTPDYPVVPASRWRIDGSINGHIVATSLVHFDSVNTTPSSGALSFRVEADLDTDIYDYEWRRPSSMAEVYGIENPEHLEGDCNGLN